MKLKNDVLANALAFSLPLLVSFGANAQESPPPPEAAPPEAVASNVFRLGQITVTGKRESESAAIGSSTLTSEEMQDFSRDGLQEALDIIPGVTTTSGAGNRNETGLSVRGFSRYQIPLYMDGIRLYLPVDGRVDYDRFLTPDLSEVQVQKGYVSVLNGPDGMGGAINLTTRKPVKPFEAELRMSAKLGEGGQYGGYTGYANVGGKQKQYYWQVSAEQRDFDHWRMSRDFKPTAVEDGGKRNNTGKKDWRANLKLGFTPNATDEYSLNYVRQEGEKHGIGSVDGNSPLSAWDWPKWNTSSLYFLSHTQLGEENYVKTKLYYNTFENDLLAWTNQRVKNWTSHYDDNSMGGSVEFGTTALPWQTLKAAFHFRRDQHDEWDENHITSPTALPKDPKQETLEDNYSFALEDTVHITSNFDLVAGISRDIRRGKKAEEFAVPAGAPSGTPKEMMDFEVADQFATNYQGAVIYRYREGGKAHFSVSRRTRFPTMFDRFSTRFGSAIPNPHVKPERATNFELGIADQILPGVRVEFAIFHNKFKDAINWVDAVDGNGNCTEAQTNGNCKTTPRNLGEATYKGFETAIHMQVMPKLELGGNYTYMSSKVDDPNYPDYKLTTAPRHKAFLYTRWKPINGLKVIPSFEYGSTRWSDPSTGSGYVRTGNFKLFNLKAEYQLAPNWDVSLAARNLFDKNYELTDGYPEEGRSFLLSTRYQF